MVSRNLKCESPLPLYYKREHTTCPVDLSASHFLSVTQDVHSSLVKKIIILTVSNSLSLCCHSVSHTSNNQSHSIWNELPVLRMLGVSEQNQAEHPTLGWVFSGSWTQRSILSFSVNTVNKSNFTPNLSHLGDIIRCVSILLFMTHNHSPKIGVCSQCLSELLCVHCFID